MGKTKEMPKITLQILTFSLFLGFAKPYDLYAINNIKTTKIGFFPRENYCDICHEDTIRKFNSIQRSRWLNLADK